MSSEYPPTSSSSSTEALQADLAVATICAVDDDPFTVNYGDVPAEEIQSKVISGRSWTDISDLDEDAVGRSVLIRGHKEAFRAVGKIVFVVLRHSISSVQCVLAANADAGVSTRMVRFATSLNKESIVEVEGVVSLPKVPVKGTTQQVEIQVKKFYCISRAINPLPFSLQDAARSEADFEKAEKKGTKPVRVLQETRLQNRALELRTPANQSIFRIKFEVENKFRAYLTSKSFIGIHSPKVTPGTSEGGSDVFKLMYHGMSACLAQSPQLYKQMVVCGDFKRVFEGLILGPYIFRAEKSNTNRHLCEYIGLDAEMEIKEHYFEICDVIDGLFIAIFKHLNENCKEALQTINEQYPFEPLKYLKKTLMLTYEEGIQMLKDAGTEIEPMGDLNTEAEKTLGRLVKEKYETDFFILHRYPLAVRPFYTMPCHDDPAYSNSFDVFMRGEEIISGSQRVHMHGLLLERVSECGIDASSISSYIKSFRFGAPPHGGFGIGLDNIRKASLFPRDPHRLEP